MRKLMNAVLAVITITVLILLSYLLFVQNAFPWPLDLLAIVLVYPFPTILFLISLAELDAKNRVRCLDKFRPRKVDRNLERQ